MSRGYEYADPAYRTYVGLLMLDYHHCNPTLLTFIDLVKEAVHSKEDDSALSMANMVGMTHRYLSTSSLSPGNCLFFSSSRPEDEQEECMSLLDHQDSEKGADLFDIQTQDPREVNFNTYRALKARQARTRWFLAYTLLFNPQLRIERKISARRQSAASEKVKRCISVDVWKLAAQKKAAEVSRSVSFESLQGEPATRRGKRQTHLRQRRSSQGGSVDLSFGGVWIPGGVTSGDVRTSRHHRRGSSLVGIVYDEISQ